jgi:tetratricopeptide (TPR) repeat protein
LLTTLCPRPSAAQAVNQLDSNPALFTVMAAIQAAGFEPDLQSTSNHPLRKQVHDAVAGLKTENMEELRKFVAEHHKREAGAELAQYVSFALSIAGPPSFKFRVPEHEMPPDVLELRGLELLLPKFYQEAGLANIWRRIQPEYDQAIDAYHAPVTQAILESTYYLRNPTSGYVGRRFQVFVELIGPPNQVQTRSYKDDYYVVVTPSPEMPINEIRYAYLHYLMDPLALKFADQLEKKRGMMDYTQSAPALDESYKTDYLLLTTTCLVKAIESRLTRGEAKRAQMVDTAFREGFVYTPAFAEGLERYEKQPTAMRIYFPELVNGIDLAKEEARLEKVEFTKEASSKRIKTAAAPPPPELKGVEKTLSDAEDFYYARKLDDARATYLRVMQETTQRPLHAKAYYGLARVAVLQKDPELAERLFQKTLELQPDGETKGWAYVYLGKLAMAAGQNDDAARKFRDAIAVDGASPKAKAEAKKALEATNVPSR